MENLEVTGAKARRHQMREMSRGEEEKRGRDLRRWFMLGLSHSTTQIYNCIWSMFPSGRFLVTTLSTAQEHPGR